ncbi:hypothetical protein GGH92_007652, partial [Coemansia sp. RSA 2673]
MHRLVTFVAGTVVGGGAIYALTSMTREQPTKVAAPPFRTPTMPQQQQQQLPVH